MMREHKADTVSFWIHFAYFLTKLKKTSRTAFRQNRFCNGLQGLLIYGEI